ncbi:hypothetical protein A0M43_04815 [Campylobacter jejuni]|uniref:hypothetical protein n=1 Tax=Campylobacter TaxID=194 RepID=UPI0001C26BB8|nr:MULTISPECIES: hypothetical protein [Campylobacter]EDO8476247.1 hypothetical protein [Campylobacter jejuni]EFC31446.1 hypothetical protein C1336_000060024 [Campylobacter jejuni subsp. jejuni 1336]KJD26491.1 hypothetical protein TM01_00335 [Campylobacter jejuni subsp. jejuni]OEW45641.1 hypothetical protein AJ888_06535 [Campylobacter sp. BCW_6467]OEX02392.1 hypothetical protein A0M43_04815 [Campylobacter jejuni]
MNESELYIYLGQDEHYITLDEMNSIVNTINIISNDLCVKLLSNYQDVSFVICPCEQGSFKLKIKHMLLGSGVCILTWLNESEAGKAFVEGLTGHETPYYYKKAGQILGDVIKGVLEKDIFTLEKINNELDNFGYILDKSIKEKSVLYEAINKSKTIKSISFSNENSNAIPKKDFINHIKKGDIIRQLEPSYEILDLIISKSINTKKQGKWTFELLETKKKFNAEILDNVFMLKFLDGFYPLKEGNRDDIIKALLRIDSKIKNGNKETEEYFIQEIFNFNKNKIKDIPKEFEKYLQVKYDYKIPSLFN